MPDKVETTNVIGIDFGTTYSHVAGYVDGAVEMIYNIEGKPTTPSAVSFDDQGNVLVGEAALTRKSGPIYDIKTLLGREFDDDVIQNSIGTWPFKLVRWDAKQGKETNARAMGTIDNIRIKIRDDPASHVDPVQLSAYVLTYLKEGAEQNTRRQVENAVLTVPAQFNSSQRQATKSAALLAGFTNARLLNESTAAALAYGSMRSSEATSTKAEERVLVFDLGGATLDVACLNFELQSGLVETLATDGGIPLGGRDFDNEIYGYTLENFQRKTGVDSKLVSDRAKQRLRIECEKVKRRLSSEMTAMIEVDYFYNDVDLSVELTRAALEQLCEKYLRKCRERVEGMLMNLGGAPPTFSTEGSVVNKRQKLVEQEKTKIDKCVLVGGCALVPAVQKMLEDMFGKEKLWVAHRPDTVVACGAALYAARVMGLDLME